ncbi:ATP-binding protein [Kibdelosporangium banguiense]|uniref:ATP-binding protein n=1 Tax=Kibdelosporangium banguiense TaxID=1365924 RepID=UPI0027DD9BFE|nr:AAA family ATPase [Kibdelosporangium banguiense]
MFGDLLLGFRRSAGLTQEELAAAAGLSVRAIGDLERGRRGRPQRRTIELLADALGLSDDDAAAFLGTARRGDTTRAANVALFDRDGQLATLERLAEAAQAGEGAAALVRAGAGMGKTSLLNVLADREATRGARVVRASGGELEQDFAFGVVRQMLEQILTQAPAAVRDRLLAGPAGQATQILGAGATPLPPDGLPGLLHSLYWLIVHTCDGGPVLLVVDDAHWADLPSLRWLDYLTRRITGLPVLLVLAARPAGTDPAEPMLERIEAQTACHRMTLPALSVDAVARWVRAELGHDADSTFCAACAMAGEGNPLLVRELLRTLREHRVEPTAGQSHLVAEFRGRLLAATVVRQLARQDEATRRLARALVVLGDGTGWHVAAALSGLGEAESLVHADRLRQIGVLGASEVARFSHPLIRAAIAESVMTPVELAVGHARAAELLYAEGSAADAVAAHLLLAEPGDGSWRVDALREAARVARGRGAPEAGARYLRRALREPAAAEQRGDLLLELGSDEVFTDPEAAAGRLSLAMSSLSDPLARGRAAGLLADALFAAHRQQRAVEVLEQAIAELDVTEAAGQEVSWHLQAQLVMIGYEYPSTIGVARQWARRLREHDVAGDTPGQRAVLLALAVAGLVGEASAAVVNDLLDRALRGELPAGGQAGLMLAIAGIGYTATDRLDDAVMRFEQMGELAVRCGSTRMSSQALAGLLNVQARRGEQIPLTPQLVRAGAEGVDITDARARLSFVNTVVGSLIERGDLAGAAEVLAQHGGVTTEAETVLWVPVLLSHCKVQAGLGNMGGALAMLLAYGSHEKQDGAGNPAVASWRLQAARIHAALGRREEARRLAAEELELAHRWGTPRVIGASLCCLGAVTGGAEGRALLAEAVAVLELSPARLESARARYEWGMAACRAGDLDAGRRTLGQALDQAEICGSRVLADQIRAELVAVGVRPGPVPPAAPSLSIIEHRVAVLRSAGRTDRQIAQALLLTPQTVAAIRHS